MYNVLAVCTANRCRSPVMQFMLAEALGASFAVRSAGTDAADGTPMHPLSIEVLAERGIDGSTFESSKLRLAMIDEADLILTAEVAHRSTVVALRPNAVNRTFTLLEFARLMLLPRAERAPGDGGHDMSPAVARAVRGRVGAVRDDDLADPIGLPLPSFTVMAERVANAAATIAAEAGVGPGRPGGDPRR